MSDPRIKPMALTDGRYAVPVTLSFDIDGESVSITDHSEAGIGDACAALHRAALEAVGGEILDAFNTDRFQKKPDDPFGLKNEALHTESTGRP